MSCMISHLRLKKSIHFFTILFFFLQQIVPCAPALAMEEEDEDFSSSSSSSSSLPRELPDIETLEDYGSISIPLR